MSEIRFNGRIRRAPMHTEVSEPNDVIWISGYGGWRSLVAEFDDLVEVISKGISHESLHLTLRRRIGLWASKALDLVLANDISSVDYCGVEFQN